MSEWIDIKKLIPELNQEVLTWDGHFIFFESYDYVLDGDCCFSQSGTSVTHWLKIPKPPTVGSNDP